jgi:hypothetical protein
MSATVDRAVFDRIAARPAVGFHGLISAGTVKRPVIDSYQQLRSTSRFGGYMVVPAERFATERLSAEFPKPPTDERVAAADLVITLGRGGACALVPGVRYLDWTVPDRAGHPLDEIRRIRDELDLLVTDLLVTLDPQRSPDA